MLKYVLKLFVKAILKFDIERRAYKLRNKTNCFDCISIILNNRRKELSDISVVSSCNIIGWFQRQKVLEKMKRTILTLLERRNK